MHIKCNSQVLIPTPVLFISAIERNQYTKLIAVVLVCGLRVVLVCGLRLVRVCGLTCGTCM